MKKILFIAAVLFGFGATAQELKPNFEKDGDLIKGTYFHDNGEIQQQGTYKDGKLHGEWVMFNDNGAKTAIGEYNNGVKTGKWFFWKNDQLTEVDYQNNTIADVTTWENTSSIANRD